MPSRRHSSHPDVRGGTGLRPSRCSQFIVFLAKLGRWIPADANARPGSLACRLLPSARQPGGGLLVIALHADASPIPELDETAALDLGGIRAEAHQVLRVDGAGISQM